MITADELTKLYASTYGVIKRQTDGMTHEDSLLQFPFSANCLNWLLGHVTLARTTSIRLLGDEAIAGERPKLERYGYGTPPLTGGVDAVNFETILTLFDLTQARLMAALEGVTQTLLDQQRDELRTIGSAILFYAGHEAFHAGQIETARMLAGKPPVKGWEYR